MVRIKDVLEPFGKIKKSLNDAIEIIEEMEATLKINWDKEDFFAPDFLTESGETISESIAHADSEVLLLTDISEKIKNL